MGACDAGGVGSGRFPADLYDARGVALLRARADEWFGARGSRWREAAVEATFRVIRRHYPDARSVVVVEAAGDDLGMLLGRRLTPFCHVRLTDACGPGIVPSLSVADVLVLPAAGADPALVAAVNESPVRVLALSAPPGLAADTGAVVAPAVRADATVVFMALPRGLCTGAAFDHRGALYFDDLGLPASVYQGIKPAACRLTSGTLRAPRPCHLDTHKGEAGSVLVMGGGPGMPGAARLAAEGASASGAGKVVAVVHPRSAPGFNVGAPELMVYDSEQYSGSVGGMFQATALGMGLGRDSWAEQMWDWGMRRPGPLVVDGDALRLLAARPRRRDDFVLTPHPGEAAALLSCSTREIQGDRYGAVRAITEAYGGICILKGAGTVIGGAGRIAVCDCAVPALARAGTGDVLAGLVAGLIAQGRPAFDAAATAVLAHAHGGLELARGAPLADLLVHVREWLNKHL